MKSAHEGGYTAVHWAATEGHKEIVDMFLDADLAIGFKSAGEDFPEIHWASAKPDLDRLERLLNGGACINAKHCAGWTPLRWAVEQGQIQSAKLLLSRQASTRGCGPLLCRAVQKNRQDVLELLLDHKAYVNQSDEQWNTALPWAAGSDSPAILAILLAHGADVQARNRKGQTPLHSAVRYWPRMASVRTLLEKAADPNAQDKDGATPLHYLANGRSAARVNPIMQRRVAEILLEYRADLDLEDQRDRTALDLAKETRSKAMENLLLEYRAKTETPKNRVH